MLITPEVAVNIAHHARQAWTYAVPNDTTGELVITQGLKPFYPGAEQRGGSTTIVDVKVDNVALDIKCRGVLGIFDKPRSDRQLAHAENKTYTELDGLWIGMPRSVTSPVRRPNVDLQGYKGDPETIISSQLAEYEAYALRTTQEAGCDRLHSVLFLYGEGRGYKSIYIEEQRFDNPKPTHYLADGRTYQALDEQGKLYEIIDYSRGSTNFTKRFQVNKGYLFAWPATTLSTQVMTESNWLAESGKLKI